MKTYKEMSKEEKANYAKQFTLKERNMYQKGKRNGWLNCFHSPIYNRKNDKHKTFKSVSYTGNLNDLFDNLDEIDL